jgi:peptide/nickel transport system permease protein
VNRAAAERQPTTSRLQIPRWVIRFSNNRAALIGFLFLALLLFVALIADHLAPYDPRAISRDRLLEPTAAHLLGTDVLGRDILSRVIFGTRVTLLVGFGAATLGVMLGTIIGALAGYFDGVLEAFLMRLVEFFQIIPAFFLALIIVSLFGAGIARVILVIGFLSWPISARIARAQFLSLKEQNFVEAARSIGFGHPHIIFREILPNASAPLIVQGSLDVGSAILIEAGLGFLGLSDPDALTWGSMLQDAKQYLQYAWWLGIYPGAAIFLAVVAFNALGDGLNDLLNPRLRSVQR